jgi:amino acid transporter
MAFLSARERRASMANPTAPSFERRLGLFQATTVNMTQMCGVGPFITIPVMIVTMQGPQAMFGWVVGAIIAIADGLVWAELGAAMPGAGGSYLYLREAFQYRTGRLMPFLFVWSAVLFIPLIMSTGVIGLVQYAGYLWPVFVSGNGLSWWGHLAAIGVVLLDDPAPGLLFFFALGFLARTVGAYGLFRLFGCFGLFWFFPDVFAHDLLLQALGELVY